jgi:hypothetical protein
MDRSYTRQLVHGDLVFARSAGPVRSRRRRSGPPVARRNVEQAARAAVHRLLQRAPVREVWTVRTDGTAIGVVDGFRLRWGPSTTGGDLALIGQCRLCNVCWFTPVRTRDQLHAAIVEDRCGCLHRFAS